MRRTTSDHERAFTLVELMIVIAIIGLLAALAVVGVRRYLNYARIGEAKHTVGGIARTASLAFEQERSVPEIPTLGGTYTANVHQLCASATPVPANIDQVRGRKYQPNSGLGTDFNTGSMNVGWQCLGFSISDPIYFQFHYHASGGFLSEGLPGAPTPTENASFEAAARGDLDADGIASTFARTGEVRDGHVVMSTTIFTHEESE